MDSPRGPNIPIRRDAFPSAGTPAAARRCPATQERLGRCRSPDVRSSSPRSRPASLHSRPIRSPPPRSRLAAASWPRPHLTSCRIAFASLSRETRTAPGPLQNDLDRTYLAPLSDAWLRDRKLYAYWIVYIALAS